MPFQGGIGGNKVCMFAGGGQVPNPANVTVQAGVPSSNARGANIGDIYVNKTTSIPYICVASTGAAGGTTWEQLGLATGSVGQLNGDTGSALPSAGVITVAGTANQITTAASGSTLTLSLPSAITAPGSVTATTTLTATLGDITATNGDFVASTAAKGPKVVGSTITGASPQINNVRCGQVGFSDVINTTATGALTITNSLITSASVIIFSTSCATVGSACVVRDYVAGSGTVTVNVTNLGGTNTGTTIFINFWILN